MRNLFLLSPQMPSEYGGENNRTKAQLHAQFHPAVATTVASRRRPEAAATEASSHSTGATSCFDCGGVAVFAWAHERQCNLQERPPTLFFRHRFAQPERQNCGNGRT